MGRVIGYTNFFASGATESGGGGGPFSGLGGGGFWEIGFFTLKAMLIVNVVSMFGLDIGPMYTPYGKGPPPPHRWWWGRPQTSIFTA